VGEAETGIEGIWFLLEGAESEAEKKGMVLEGGELGGLSYAKEAIFPMEEPRRTHC